MCPLFAQSSVRIVASSVFELRLILIIEEDVSLRFVAIYKVSVLPAWDARFQYGGRIKGRETLIPLGFKERPKNICCRIIFHEMHGTIIRLDIYPCVRRFLVGFIRKRPIGDKCNAALVRVLVTSELCRRLEV